MWHEARRQERKIRKFIVDHKKRSERRHEYYERIKQDPTKFLQVHGRKTKIHLDGTVAAEADNNHHMMPWQGDSTNMIDRFDVRTHLDYYVDTPSKRQTDEPITEEERKCNFERYRVLIWNEFKHVSEHQHLRQIFIEEQFPEMAAEQKQSSETQKQMLAQSRATIGYDYEVNEQTGGDADEEEEDEDEEKDDFDITAELEEIPPLSEINMEAITALDEIGVKSYGLRRGGFGDCLLDDQDYMDKIGAAKALESEKQKFSGRKSRRERKLLKDERLKGRKISTLSYVRQESSSESSEDDSSSESSNSNSSDEDGTSKAKSKGNIEYITSFGGEPGKISAKLSSFNESKKSESGNEPKNRKYRRSRSYSPERNSKKTARSRSRSRSPRYRKSFSRSRRSRSRSHERRRSRSKDRLSSRSRYEKGSRSSYYSQDSRESSSRYSKPTHTASASITSTSQSSENILKTISRTKTAEEKAAVLGKLTPQQKLKIKMQRALNKQLKVDRHADNEKRLIKQQELMERDDDIREMSRKMRQRAGERREYPDSPYH